MSERFWLVANTEQDMSVQASLGPVWFLTRRAPRVVHATETDAEREAVRLARAHPGHEFAILEVRAAVKVVDGVPRWSNPA